MKKNILMIGFLMICISTFSQFPENRTYENKYNPRKSVNFIKDRSAKSTALMNKYDVKFYWLNINLERTSIDISGNVTINAKVQGAALDTFEIELVSELTVDSAKVNGVICPFTHTTDYIEIKLPAALPVGSNISTQIFYHGTPPSGGFFSGISHGTSQSWGNEVVWTLSEPFNANQWWPCKQDLTDKADSSWVFVTTDSTNKVGSNGLLMNVVNLNNGKFRYEWKSRNPIDYYLISVAVAKYVDYTIYCHPVGVDSLMIQNYIYNNPATLPNFKNIIDSTAEMIELYSQLYGPYPFNNEKYGHSMAPIGGGMEHQTMTTLGSFSFMLVCHELAHMWWGDNVTCATWSDIWVNEGFASYGEYLSNQYLRSQASANADMLSVHNNVMSEQGGSVFIPLSEVGNISRIFDGRLSYDKGSAIVHMIRFELQDDTLFFNILKTFQTQFNKNVATGNDFKTVAQTLSGKDFTDFFNQWYYGEGYPTYSIVWNQVNDTVTFKTTQTTSTTITPLFKMLMEYKLKSASGDTIVKCYQTANVNTFKIHTHKVITGIEIDPNNWVLNKVGTIVVGNTEIANTLSVEINPNPCSDNLYIHFSNPEKIRTVVITDISGREIKTLNSNFDKLEINIEDLCNGIYFIKISDDNHSITRKLVKE